MPKYWDVIKYLLLYKFASQDKKIFVQTKNSVEVITINIKSESDNL